MTDVANPEHTGFEFEQYADVALPGGYDTHSAYEGYVSTMWNQTHAGQTGANTFHQIVKNQENVNYRITNPSTATKNIAKFSHAYLPTLYYRVANQPYIDSNHRGFYDDPTVGKITENCLKIAARYTGGLVEYTMGNSINEVPIADFTGNPVFVTPGGSVQFLDKTQYSGPLTTHVDWNFGDNTPHFTADDPSPYTPENPYPHQYSTPGIYTVNLTVSNSNGATSKTMDIIVGNWPVADFMATAVVTDSEYTFHFTDLSTNSPTHWTWDFGDGNTSTEQNPSHRFAAVRQYDVTMTASNAAGPGKITKTILTLPPNPIVEFLINEGQHGPAPLVTSFKDDSVGWTDSRTWDFGDNTTSNEKDPVHVYQYPGSYVVRLTVVSNGIGSNSTTSTVVATPPLPLIANFTSTSPNGTAPLTVQFTDTSTGSPTSWNWSFGDGSYSSLQNANHTYTQYGNFDISLTVSNATSSNTTILQYFITVTPDESLKPTITSISPGMGFNSGTVSITDLTGTNFTTGSTVALVNSRLNHAGSITYGMSNVTMDIPTDVFVSGNYAYVTSEEVSGLEIFDISDSAHPAHKGSISDGTGGAHLAGLYDVYVSGNYAYLPDFYSNALEIVDVSDPANPVHKGSITDGTGGAQLAGAYGIYVSGNYAYVASQSSNALEIVDISDPANPVHKGSLTNGAGGANLYKPYDVFVSGNYAYVIGTGGLEIVNVNNPASPFHKGSLTDGAGGALLGAPTDIYVSNNYAYIVCEGSGALEIVDISNKVNPVHKGSLTNGAGGALLYGAEDISVSGNLAYIVSYYGSSLEIVDISDPAHPVHKIGLVNGENGTLLKNPYGVHISGNHVYIASLNNGGALEILETGTVTIPASNVTLISPTNISCTFDLSGAAAGTYDVRVTGANGQSGTLTNAFIVSNRPPKITGITPSSGTRGTTIAVTNLTGTGFLPGASVQMTRAGSSPISASNVVIVSPTKITCNLPLPSTEGVWDIIVTNHDGQNSSLVNGFSVTNVSLSVTGTTPASGARGATIAVTDLSGTGFLSGASVRLNRTDSPPISATNVVVVSTTRITCDLILPANSTEGIWDVVVTNPNMQSSTLSNGFTITSMSESELTVTSITPSIGVNTAAVSITNLSGTNFTENAKVLLSRVNSNPVHKGKFLYGTGNALMEWPVSVFVSGNHAYIASYDSWALEILDISNPANPVHTSYITDGTGGAQLMNPNGVYAAGNYAYVASYGSNALEIVNVTDPASPTHKGSIHVGGARSIYVSGNYAYVLSTDGLTIVSISDPANPVITGSIGVGGYGVYVSGNFAYIANRDGNSLSIVDVSNPAQPVLKGSLSDGTGGAHLAGAYGVYVSGNHAYVTSAWSNALEIVDVSDPAHPVHKGSITHGTGGAILNEPTSVYVSGNYAYIASYQSDTLEVVDVSNPTNPVHKSSLSDGTGGAIFSHPICVVVSGSNAYVLNNGLESLEIVDIGTIPATGVTVVSPTKITGAFNLTNKIPGLYDVVVVNPEGMIGILENGFMITG